MSRSQNINQNDIINGNEIMQNFIKKTETYNHSMCLDNSSMSMNTKSKAHFNDVTEQILFCQNGIDNLNMSSNKTSSTFNKESSEEIKPIDEVLMVDIISNGYKYEDTSFELNIVQPCYVVSIISPYAFTIQLQRDLIESDKFFKNMNDYYNSIYDLQLTQEYLRKNLLCVTYDEITLTWNRSQIMEYDLNQDTVNVFFVDLNSWEENVSRSRIRFILTKYSSRPVHLLTCRLATIASLNDDTEWNDVVLRTFQNLVHNCQCDVEPLYKRCDNTFYVNLFAQHDEVYVCINDFLIHCKMARPIDDITNDDNTTTFMLDDDGQPMHSIIALYWKAGETASEKDTSIKSQDDQHRSEASTEPFQTKSSFLTKLVLIDEKNKIIFARYNSYIMVPWFILSDILKELDEEKIKILANTFGFKPSIINPLKHVLLCSQLLKLASSASISSEISLYSIDCVRKILKACHYTQAATFDLLDRARLAEASNDMTFWDQSFEG
ncbi:unnamed protein product [Rotaria socialis]|uniref:Tudor domain-containing protein n=1 Tax=Rotaria socialis TaxID=392032 RepID=A0A817T4A8_9BILA|nr:unnamed protein product [Rotaria socialis]CAF4535050.1 unnamed protein product [Rotaria socialis]